MRYIEIILRYIVYRKKSPLDHLLTELRHQMPTMVYFAPQSYRSNFYTSFDYIDMHYKFCVPTECVIINTKLLWCRRGHHMYLMERYPHPYYHCSGSCISRLYQQLVHRLASLYLSLSICHLERKYSHFIADES